MKNKIIIAITIMFVVITAVFIQKSNIKEKIKTNAKANNENYTDKETEERNAKSVFDTGTAITVKKKTKTRDNKVIVKQVTVIGTDNKSKPTNLSRFETEIGNGGSAYIELFIFPDEEIFFTNYDEAVNHMIENYENGKTGSFIKNYLPMNHLVKKWPENTTDQEMLRNLGYFPKTMTVAYNTR